MMIVDLSNLLKIFSYKYRIQILVLHFVLQLHLISLWLTTTSYIETSTIYQAYVIYRISKYSTSRKILYVVNISYITLISFWLSLLLVALWPYFF